MNSEEALENGEIRDKNKQQVQLQILCRQMAAIYEFDEESKEFVSMKEALDNMVLQENAISTLKMMATKIQQDIKDISHYIEEKTTKIEKTKGKRHQHLLNSGNNNAAIKVKSEQIQGQMRLYERRIREYFLTKRTLLIVHKKTYEVAALFSESLEMIEEKCQSIQSIISNSPAYGSLEKEEENLKKDDWQRALNEILKEEADCRRETDLAQSSLDSLRNQNLGLQKEIEELEMHIKRRTTEISDWKLREEIENEQHKRECKRLEALYKRKLRAAERKRDENMRLLHSLRYNERIHCPATRNPLIYAEDEQQVDYHKHNKNKY